MVGQIVEHIRFGRGVVTGFEPPRLEVRFDGEEAPRRFSYPGVTSKFLRFTDPEAARRARSDLEAASVLTQQEVMAKIEANRRREEQIATMRMEALRKKRTDAARKAAERRKQAAASKQQTAEQQA